MMLARHLHLEGQLSPLVCSCAKVAPVVLLGRNHLCASICSFPAQRQWHKHGLENLCKFLAFCLLGGRQGGLQRKPLFQDWFDVAHHEQP